MARGYQRQRLDEALDTAKPGRVGSGEDQWRIASRKLSQVASHLRQAAHLGLDIKGDTGQAMFRTMLESANRLERRSQQMERGGSALRDTASAIIVARAARDEIDTRLPPLTPEPFSAPQGYDDLPAWRQTEVRNRHDQTQTGLVEAREQEREDAARKVAEAFERDYRPPIKVMQDIYGYEPPPPAPPGNAPTPTYAPAGGSGRTSGSYAGPRRQGHPVPTDGGPDGPGPTGGDPVPTDPGPGDGGPNPGPIDPGPGDGGPPTSPWVDIPGTYGDAGPSSDGGGSGPSVSPAVLGTGAGVVAAGALGAAARGGLASAGASALRNLTGRGGPLGGTVRGAGPVLGRSGVGTAGTPTSSRGTGAAGRGAGGLRSGAGTGAGAGRGGRGAGGARGRGAGGRAGGMGVGGKHGRGRNEEEQRTERDLFDDGQDWIDDEGAAPGVLE